MSRWVAMHCGEDADMLQEKHPNAFLLLCQIARRARWKDCTITGLVAGEAFIGDWKAAGLPSKKAYQVAKLRLEKCGLVDFQGGNKGTRAILLNSTIFSLSQDDKGKPEGPPRGIEGESRGNQGGTIHPEHPETKNPPNPPAGGASERDASLIGKIKSLRRRWGSGDTLDAKDNRIFQKNRAGWLAYGESDWGMVEDFVRASLPDGTGYTQPRNLNLALSMPTTLLSEARDWKSKRRLPEPCTVLEMPAADDPTTQAEAAAMFKELRR